ncbi:DUF2213 domain-containing protein [Uliginosibacterium sp. sgz301328]|uniref:DUF2213 domain-containing protein n=1 Tax=Uliginosibacterium sp. sgz301328 TaxID=3243764 RepID=UPI00359D0BC6
MPQTMKRIRSGDRAAFFTTEKLGDRRELTPEGFLLCKGVAIARTGQQLYSSGEIPIEDTGNGEVRIQRDADEVFRDETIASFEGKPVTVTHPDEFVTPQNWNRLAVGVVQNVRRGDGISDDLLVADLLITSADAIEYVNRELPELSAGYEADYEQTEPGHGVQRNIIGNHVALVERGRAGPRCSILDHEGSTDMKTKDAKPAGKQSFRERLRAFLDAEPDEKEDPKAMIGDEDGDDDEDDKEKAKTGDAIATLTKTVDALTKTVAKLVKDAEAKAITKTDDEDEDDPDNVETDDDLLEAETAGKADTGTTYTGDALAQIFSRAEILSPGISIPTGDAAKGKDVGIKLMRKAIGDAMKTEDGKKAIDVFLMGRDAAKLSAVDVPGVFNGAAELIRVRNNDRGTRAGITTKDFGRQTNVADINAANRKYWASRSAQ